MYYLRGPFNADKYVNDAMSAKTKIKTLRK